MKKIFLSLLLSIIVFAVQAQTKVTKENIVGKWNASIMKVEGTIHYDIEKDSLVLSAAVLAQLGASGVDSASATDMMKAQFGSFKELVFEFKVDGTYTIGSASSEKSVEMGTFTIDEAKETITLTNKEKGETQTSPVSFKNNRLILNMGEGEQKAILEFKKG